MRLVIGGANINGSAAVHHQDTIKAVIFQGQKHYICNYNGSFSHWDAEGAKALMSSRY